MYNGLVLLDDGQCPPALEDEADPNAMSNRNFGPVASIHDGQLGKNYVCPARGHMSLVVSPFGFRNHLGRHGGQNGKPPEPNDYTEWYPLVMRCFVTHHLICLYLP